jgi:hypothetical protein
MADGTFLEGNAHAAENQLAAGGEAVDVGADAEAEGKGTSKVKSQKSKARRTRRMARTPRPLDFTHRLWTFDFQL